MAERTRTKTMIGFLLGRVFQNIQNNLAARGEETAELL